MRRSIELLVPVVGALACAVTANAHIISVVQSSEGTSASDTLTVDVMLDTEGMAIYGVSVYVDFDPAVLSPDAVSSQQNPLTGEVYTSFYMYPDSWYISSSTLEAGGMGPFNQSIATLVFHVIQSAASTYITPNFTYGSWGAYVEFDGSLPVDVTGQVTLTALHVPEPTATALALAAIGTLALLRVRRGRAR